MFKNFFSTPFLLFITAMSLFPLTGFASSYCDGSPTSPRSYFPGHTYTIIQGDYCSTVVSDCDGGNDCSASADLYDRRLQMQTYVIVGISDTKRAKATLSNRFRLEGDLTEERSIRANLSGSGSWAGRLMIGPSSGQIAAEVTVAIELLDETDGNRTVAEQTLHSSSCELDTLFPSACLRFPQGSTNYNFAVDLIRGHTYTIHFVAECKSSYNGAAVDVICDFEDDSVSPNGVSRSDIRVAISRDFEEELDELREQLDELLENFEVHTHEYATGKGVGHNKVTVDTGQPKIYD